MGQKSGGTRRYGRLGALGAALFGGALVVSTASAWATTYSQSGQTMEGDLQIPAGSTMAAGYDFTDPAGS